MHGPDALERYPHGIAEGCQRVFVLAGELRIGNFSGQPHRQQFLITGDALETRARGEQIRRHQIKLETFGQGLRQSYEHLTRIGDPRQLTACPGEQRSGRRPPLVKPLVEESLDPQTHRLQQHDQQDSGGKRKEVTE